MDLDAIRFISPMVRLGLSLAVLNLMWTFPRRAAPLPLHRKR